MTNFTNNSPGVKITPLGLNLGITRAAITKAQGGKWSAGFWSGFASSAFSVGNEGYGGKYGRTAIMATVGGTVSEISGGKFAQ